MFNKNNLRIDCINVHAFCPCCHLQLFKNTTIKPDYTNNIKGYRCLNCFAFLPWNYKNSELPFIFTKDHLIKPCYN